MFNIYIYINPKRVSKSLNFRLFGCSVVRFMVFDVVTFLVFDVTSLQRTLSVANVTHCGAIIYPSLNSVAKM